MTKAAMPTMLQWSWWQQASVRSCCKNNARNGEGTSTLIFSCCGGFVDGSEIRRSPVDMVKYPIIYDGFHTCQVVGLGISEPSTVVP